MTDFAEELNKEFSSDGFFYNIRKMKFIKTEAVRAIEKIRRLDFSTYSEDEKKDVALLIWNLPVMALWWRDRCVEMGADKAEFEAYARELQRVVEEKLKALLGQQP
ncbi:MULTISPECIES: hypothetical protein [unclassified Rhizobium]|uniref:hypothetical protein n=1 Tax=unclassified Rhizobium TaxID=2613769 RepID=UPI0007EBB2F6|nr:MULTISPECIES: hypothetical protein [unclassified Rhizobium]ANK86253.1 hypothetical protein AMK02_CH02685 [Rhizobium sp. N731]ANL16499.1 hypothetical protein AMJ97_CH02683 [Rhizobium sp. N1314]